MPFRIPTDYRRMNPQALIIESGTVASAMQANEIFVNNPHGVASASQILAGRDKLREAFEAALTHDSLKILARNAAREELVLLLDSVAKYLELVALTNPAAVKNHGFSSGRRSRTSTPAPLPPPANFSVYQGPQPGSVIAKATRLATASSYEVHVAEGDTSIEENWFYKSVFPDPSMMIINGYASGKQIAVRSRGVNLAGPGAWSAPVSIIVR